MTSQLCVNASVVIAAELTKAIAGALQQSHARLRVAVMEEASSDGTPALRSEFKTASWERWEQKQGRVRTRSRVLTRTILSRRTTWPL
jgi:hypothetical protein